MLLAGVLPSCPQHHNALLVFHGTNCMPIHGNSAVEYRCTCCQNPITLLWVQDAHVQRTLLLNGSTWLFLGFNYVRPPAGCAKASNTHEWVKPPGFFSVENVT